MVDEQQKKTDFVLKVEVAKKVAATESYPSRSLTTFLNIHLVAGPREFNRLKGTEELKSTGLATHYGDRWKGDRCHLSQLGRTIYLFSESGRDETRNAEQ